MKGSKRLSSSTAVDNDKFNAQIQQQKKKILLMYNLYLGHLPKI